MMVNYFGSIPMFMANIQTQMENFNKFGPPKLSCSLMSKEDIIFANQFNEFNIDGFNLGVFRIQLSNMT